MKKCFSAIALALIASISLTAAERKYDVASPDGTLKTEVVVGETISYSVFKNDQKILDPSVVAMELSDGTVFGKGGAPKKVTRSKVDNVLDATFYKKSKVVEKYNELAFTFKTYKLIFRVYDAGVAYRFESLKKGEYQVVSEIANFAFPGDWNVWVPYVKTQKHCRDNQFFNSFENLYEYCALSAWDKQRYAFLPVMFAAPCGYKVNIMESDLTSYPGMYLSNTDGDSSVEAKFAPYPKTVEQGGHNMLQGLVREYESYIAKCSGPTAFPWRIVSVSAEDKDMLGNDLVWLLGTPADSSKDWSWVKPGKVAWEWWNDWNITGVDFKAGVNNDTYKYYIDFASKNGIEYVILDEGWATKYKTDLFDVVPKINLPELVAYAAERNVGLVLWAGYWAFNKDMDKVCEHYSKMGIKGWKVDFMDRDDQQMVDFYHRCAKTAAKYNMFLDMHGGFKPCGLNRTYPNVLNYEGVYGLENMKWYKGHDHVTYDVQIPFIRMAAGPMDYTQGAMLNGGRKCTSAYSEPKSQGTRCRQLGMYVVFESPFNMLCDTPIHYEKEIECTEFIASVPTVWDETVALDGKVGEYVVIARRKGDVWYIGGLTDWKKRTIEINLDVLGGGNWNVELFTDGVNVGRNAKDYKKTNFSATGSFSVKMTPGGGFAARLIR